MVVFSAEVIVSVELVLVADTRGSLVVVEVVTNPCTVDGAVALWVVETGAPPDDREGGCAKKAAASEAIVNAASSRSATTLRRRRFGGVITVFCIKDFMQYGQKLASLFSSAPQNGHRFITITSLLF